MKIHGTAKGGALSTKDFGVAFGGAAAPTGETWDSETGLTNCTLSDSDTTATATSATSWYCRANSTNIKNNFTFTIGGSGADNFRVALVTGAQRISGSPEFFSDTTSFMLLIEGLAGSTTANLYTYTDGSLDNQNPCNNCIDTTKSMTLTKSGSTWTFKVDDVTKTTYSSSSDFYLQNLVQKASMFITLA